MIILNYTQLLYLQCSCTIVIIINIHRHKQTSNLCSEENIVDAHDNESYGIFYLFTYLFIYFIKKSR